MASYRSALVDSLRTGTRSIAFLWWHPYNRVIHSSGSTLFKIFATQAAQF